MSYLDRDEDAYYFHDTYERCRFHPRHIVSNGMFDAPCPACEAQMEDEFDARREFIESLEAFQVGDLGTCEVLVRSSGYVGEFPVYDFALKCEFKVTGEALLRIGGLCDFGGGLDDLPF